MRLLIRSQSTTTTQLLTQWMSNIVRMDKEGWVDIWPAAGDRPFSVWPILPFWKKKP